MTDRVNVPYPANQPFDTGMPPALHRRRPQAAPTSSHPIPQGPPEILTRQVEAPKPIEVELPNGAVLEFPAGTEPQIVERRSREALQHLRGADAGRTEESPSRIETGVPALDDVANSFIGRTVAAIPSVGRRVYEAAAGSNRDPQYQDVGGFVPSEAFANDMPSFAASQRAQMVAPGDEAYHDVVRDILGDRYIQTIRDKNGQPIVEYKDENGQPTARYLNEPGLDSQDISRFIAGGIPYAVGGAVAGNAVKGAGMLTRGIAQGGAMGTVSGLQDAGAAAMGSEQGLDTTRMAMAAGLGAGAAVLPLSVTGAAIGGGSGMLTGETPEEMMAGALVGIPTGAAAGAGMSRMLTRRNPHFEDGKLISAEARKAYRRATATKENPNGLNPDELDPMTARVFAQNWKKTATPEEILADQEAGRFGIKTTRGQRTKNQSLISDEEVLRRGRINSEGERLMKQFDAEQKDAIQRAAFSRFQAQSPKAPPHERGVGEVLAGRQVTPINAQSFETGTNISQGLRAARDAGDDAVASAWQRVQDIVPDERGLAQLPQTVMGRSSGINVDDVTTPVAYRMLGDINKYVRGELRSGPSVGDLEAPVLQSVDQMRRRLLSAYKAAQNPADKAASKSIYDSVNRWIDDVAENGFTQSASPEAAAALRTAREITKEVRQTWSGIDRRGRATPGSRLLEKIDQSEHTPEAIMRTLFGGTGPQRPSQPAVVEALTRIKRGLFNAPGGARVDSEIAARTWNDIRLAGWSRLVLTPEGKMHTPRMVVKNINAALNQQQSIMYTLYTHEERRLMREYARAVHHTDWQSFNPNPSGSASTLMAKFKGDGFIEGAARVAAQTKQKSETFARRRFIMARIYQLIAKHIPGDVFGSKDALARASVKAATSDKLFTRNLTSGRAAIGGASSGRIGEEVNNRMRRYP